MFGRKTSQEKNTAAKKKRSGLGLRQAHRAVQNRLRVLGPHRIAQHAPPEPAPQTTILVGMRFDPAWQ